MNDTNEDLQGTLRHESLLVLGWAATILFQEDWCSGRGGTLTVGWGWDGGELIGWVQVPLEPLPGAEGAQHTTNSAGGCDEEYGARLLAEILGEEVRAGQLSGEAGVIDFDIKHDGEGRRWAANADLSWTDRDLGNELATEDR